ncbi:MAG: hypothetical protein GY906_04050, partial [bacterium]|nr:hypothetical protein [bacterium]
RMQLQAFTGLAGYGVAELPLICVYFARFSAFGLLLGPAVFGLGFVFLSRDPSPSVKAELVSTLALVFALAVVVGCLLAWQLPYYVPVVEID